MALTDEVKPEAWARESLPMLSPTAISYDFPAGGLDPFDLQEAETQWFVDARGYTRAWKHSEGERAVEYMSPTDSEFSKKIPMGYKYIRILEKLAVVTRGLLAREWPETSRAPDSMPDAHGYFQKFPYLVYFKRLREPSLYVREWRAAARTATSWPPSKSGEILTLPAENYRAALALALSFPPETDEAIMVVRVLDHFGYH
ncbi:hypothetical protein LVJ94_02195 [Pendulispora rubella]|uniref:Uncharacterized protein n=1 Tax=Pendulispora rubella TaxID=2741070 RepID=A0ABZ2L933_9BACT